ncbi:cytochrome P450 [Sporosarcina cascadiensis]|uniref:cytochrome P450 n=1 Tax=Sporosarcina cascadiensis TaxID=2660747 RepID=UPI00129B8C89|nr:cytochrome P450 [Sporosarcina cascadiensis]
MVIVEDIATPRLQNYQQFTNDPIGFFMRMRPLGDVVSMKTGFSPTYIVNSPEAIREILIRHDQSFIKGRTTKVLQRTVGEGLLTTEGERHGFQKKYMQPTFYKEALERYAYAIVEETERVAERLEQAQEFDIHSEMMQLTLSIITRTMFSTDVSAEEKKLADAVTTTIEMLEATLILAVLYKNFTFSNLRPHAPVPEPLISLRIKDGWPMRIETVTRLTRNDTTIK